MRRAGSQGSGQGRRRAFAACVAWMLALATAPACAQSLFASGFEPARPVMAGGSNYIWYSLDESCERDPYAIIPNYHEPGVRPLVRDQLQAMRAAGQLTLSLGMFHLRAPELADSVGRVNGTLLDSSGGTLHPRQLQNLGEFLADIRDAGFASVIFRYHPQGPNNPREWSSLGPTEQDFLEENWSLIHTIEPLLQQSGLDWGTDLLVEGAPRARIVELPGDDLILPGEPHKGGWSRYAREIWKRYSTEFGTSRTFGFSFVSDTDSTRIDARVEHMEYVYKVDGVLRLPIGLALDIYGTAGRDEEWIFRTYRRHLADEGLGDMVWVIAESYFNDAQAAEGFQAAMTATGQAVFALTQWPLHREGGCDPNVTVAPPVGYDAYRNRGF